MEFTIHLMTNQYPFRRIGKVILLSCLLLMWTDITASAGIQAVPVFESSSSDRSDEKQDSEWDVRSKRRDVEQRIKKLQAEIEKHGPTGTSKSVELELDLLSWLDLTYSQLESLEAQHQSVMQKIAELKDELATLAKFGVDEKPPYSFLLLDEIRGEITTQNGRLDSLKSRESLLVDAIEEAKSNLIDAESKRRQADEVNSQENDSRPSLSNQKKYETILWQIDARTAVLEQMQKEAEVNELEIEAQSLRLQILQNKEEIVAADVRFGQQDLETRIKLLEQADAELRSELSVKLRQLACSIDDAGQSSSTSVDPNAKIHNQSLCRLRTEILQKEIGFIRQLLRKLVEMRAAWRWRYEIANGLLSVQQLHEVSGSLNRGSERIQVFSDSLESQLDELRDALLVLRKTQLEKEAGSDKVAKETPAKITVIEQSSANLNSYISLSRAGQRLLQRAQDEAAHSLSPSDTWVFFSSVAYWAGHIWNYEIAVVDNRSLTIGKILCALGLLLGSIFLARVLSRMLGTRLLPRLGVNAAGASALQSIAFYILTCCLTLMVLDFVNVPLAGFAFMGGAIAIGVGFGSQNIINNFISGLILLAERPIRQGDLVDIDGLLANVQHIGARSTRVRTGANLEIVVPNSKFLENNVANWTLSNPRTRVSINVGVAYGSNPDEVIEHLKIATCEHPSVLATPEPIILFKEFGDNALLFESHFWIYMRTLMEGETIRSEIRCRIDKLLSDANITIAFPQRDVHLDTVKPLEINVRQINAAEKFKKDMSNQKAA